MGRPLEIRQDIPQSFQVLNVLNFEMFSNLECENGNFILLLHWKTNTCFHGKESKVFQLVKGLSIFWDTFWP